MTKAEREALSAARDDFRRIGWEALASARRIDERLRGAPLSAVDFDPPPWFELASGEIGTAEVRGGENPRIIEYHAETSLRATEDEVSWCSAFVCWAFERSGIPSTRSAAARSWLQWGSETSRPEVGDVVVLWRESPDSWKGHAGFFVGFDGDGDSVRVLGGNQGDAVSVATFPRSRILGFRKPNLAT